MKDFISKLKKTFSSEDEHDMDDVEDQYVELDTMDHAETSGKMIVRPFVMSDFSDIKGVLNILREGNTIALVNIKPLKEKDLVELKRAINKLKKTCDAVAGDIAGFGDDFIVVTPSSAVIYRSKDTESIE